MRFLGMLAAALVLASCGSGSERCDPPPGCLRTDHVAGACACVAWQTVSTESVRLPFVLSGVRYSPVGTASVFHLGTTSDPSQVPESASGFGTLLRAVVRRADGTDVIARVGSLDPWLQAQRVSATSVIVGRGGGLWTLGSEVDVPSSDRDDIAVFTNLVATVGTDAGGGKTVDWSWAPPFFTPIGGIGAEAIALSPGLIRGEVHWDVYHDDYLASLSTVERAALLAFDPHGAGSAIEWPRYLFLSEVALIDGTEPVVRDATWWPCVDPEEFSVVAETAVPMSGSDTLVLQYGVQHDASCTPQRPGLLAGTGTPGCTVHAYTFVDRLSGTLLMEPLSATSACTAP